MIVIKNRISGLEKNVSYAFVRGKMVKELWDVTKFEDIVMMYQYKNGVKGKPQIVELEHAMKLQSEMPNEITFMPYTFEDYKTDTKLADVESKGGFIQDYESKQIIKRKDRDVEVVNDEVLDGGYSLVGGKSINFPSHTSNKMDDISLDDIENVDIPKNFIELKPSINKDIREKKIFLGIAFHPDVYTFLAWIVGVLTALLVAFIVFKLKWL